MLLISRQDSSGSGCTRTHLDQVFLRQRSNQPFHGTHELPSALLHHAENPKSAACRITADLINFKRMCEKLMRYGLIGSLSLNILQPLNHERVCCLCMEQPVETLAGISALRSRLCRTRVKQWLNRRTAASIRLLKCTITLRSLLWRLTTSESAHVHIHTCCSQYNLATGK